jgi:hypothetical protein
MGKIPGISALCPRERIPIGTCPGARRRTAAHSTGWNDLKIPRYYTRELAAWEPGMHEC